METCLFCGSLLLSAEELAIPVCSNQPAPRHLSDIFMAQKAASQETDSSDARLAIGADVQIINFNSATHYNGQLTTILETFNDETGRWTATLNDGLKKLPLKSCNLKLVKRIASLEE